MKARTRKKRLIQGFTKAQLQRQAGSLRGQLEKAKANYDGYVRHAIGERHALMRDAETAVRQAAKALDLLEAVAPQLAQFWRDPRRLPEPPPDDMRSIRVPLGHRPMLKIGDAYSIAATATREEFLARARMEIVYGCIRADWALCFRMYTETQGRNVACKVAMPQRLLAENRSAFRLAFAQMAGELQMHLERALFV